MLLMRYFYVSMLLCLAILCACGDDPPQAIAITTAAPDVALPDSNEKFGDFSRAERWYLHFHLPTVNDGIHKRFEVIEPLLEADDLVAVKKFARAYSGGRGPMGGPQDFEKSFALCMNAAERGAPGAMMSVGAMYMRGTGTRQDHREALLWFEKAYEATGAVGAAAGIAAIYNGYDKSQMKNPGKAAQWREIAEKRVENHGAIREQERAEKAALQAALTAEVDDGNALMQRYFASEYALIERNAQRNVPDAVYKLANIKLGKDYYWSQTGFRSPVDLTAGVQLLEQYYEMEIDAGMRQRVAGRLADLYSGKSADDLKDTEKEAFWRSRED